MVGFAIRSFSRPLVVFGGLDRTEKTVAREIRNQVATPTSVTTIIRLRKLYFMGESKRGAIVSEHASYQPGAIG